MSDSTVFEVELVTDAAHNPINFPRYTIPPGAQVEIYPLSTNAATAFTSTSPGGAKGGTRKVIPPTQAGAVYYSVDELCELWLFTTNVGEGITLRIIKAATAPNLAPKYSAAQQAYFGAGETGGHGPGNPPRGSGL